jgi:hypothetical protein
MIAVGSLGHLELLGDIEHRQPEGLALALRFPLVFLSVGAQVLIKEVNDGKFGGARWELVWPVTRPCRESEYQH